MFRPLNRKLHIEMIVLTEIFSYYDCFLAYDDKGMVDDEFINVCFGSALLCIGFLVTGFECYMLLLTQVNLIF